MKLLRGVERGAFLNYRTGGDWVFIYISAWKLPAHRTFKQGHTFPLNRSLWRKIMLCIWLCFMREYLTRFDDCCILGSWDDCSRLIIMGRCKLTLYRFLSLFCIVYWHGFFVIRWLYICCECFDDFSQSSSFAVIYWLRCWSYVSTFGWSLNCNLVVDDWRCCILWFWIRCN